MRLTSHSGNVCFYFGLILLGEIIKAAEKNECCVDEVSVRTVIRVNDKIIFDKTLFNLKLPLLAH